MADSAIITATVADGATISSSVTEGTTVQATIANGATITGAVTVGAQGPAGQGVPTGGTTGQVLAKNSNTNYDTTWSTVSSGVTDHTLLSNIGTNTHAQIDTHLANTSNPHSVTKAQVGLGSADNTSDLAKPVSTATQTAIDKTRTNTFTITRSGTADYICDGVDDNVQIQAAIDALNTAGGGTLFVRAGTYRITVAVAVPENVTIRGERMARQATGGVTFKTTAATSLTDMFTVTGTANPASNADLKHDIVFENITFDGNNTTTNNVKLTNQDTVKFIDCRFIQSTNSLVTVWNSTVAPTAATIPGGIYAVRCNFSPAAGGIGVDLQYQTQCWFISCWHTPPSGTPAAHFRIKACNKIDIQGSEFNTATAALKFEDVNLGGAMDYSNYDINVNAKTFANGGTVISSTMSHASSGNIKIRGTMSNGTTIGDKLIGSGNLVEVNDSFTPFSVLSQAAADKVMTLKGYASQSGRYLEAQNSSAVAVAYMNSGGNWYVNNGSTSAVSYGFTSEINSGMYRVSAGILGFVSAGTKVAEIGASGLTIASIAATGTPSSTTYLRGDGTWSTPSGSGGITRSIVSVTTTTTLGATASTDYVALVGASGVPTLPTAVGNTNRYTVVNVDTTNKTLSTTSAQTINGSASATIIPGQSLELISDNANWRII